MFSFRRTKEAAVGSPIPVTIDNSDIIRIYHQMRDEWKLISADEPNYDLAEKVFLEFNDFNLRNHETIGGYLRFIPKSLLPYPKNYIKCAYYIFFDSLINKGNRKMADNVKEIAVDLFLEYPDWDRYQENLKRKSWFDDLVFKDKNPSPRELFKEYFGDYQITKKQYDSSPSSVDVTDEKLIWDFGKLPEIEDDVDISKMVTAKQEN